MNARDIAKKLFWTILTLFAFLEYFSAFRPFIQAEYGIYGLGLVDGCILVSLILVIIFYIESFFEKEPPERTKKTKLPRKPESKKVKPSFVKEIIQRCEIIQSIVERVNKQLGNYLLPQESVRIDEVENAEFKKQMEWLAQNYPKIARELNRATRMSYVDPIRKISVKDYDPLLQTIAFSSLQSVFANSFTPKEFLRNLESGIARLRAYLGLISE